MLGLIFYDFVKGLYKSLKKSLSLFSYIEISLYFGTKSALDGLVFAIFYYFILIGKKNCLE